jgi:hypothetical protein
MCYIDGQKNKYSVYTLSYNIRQTVQTFGPSSLMKTLSICICTLTYIYKTSAVSRLYYILHGQAYDSNVKQDKYNSV